MHKIKFTNIIDRTQFEKGPWDNEEIDVQFWISNDNRICSLNRSNFGSLRGYVGINEYFEIKIIQQYSNFELSNYYIHGGITFCDYNSNIDVFLYLGVQLSGYQKTFEKYLEPQKPIFWIGFDCLHSSDISPLDIFNKNKNKNCTYKDINFVTKEAEKLSYKISEKINCDLLLNSKKTNRS